MNKMTNLELAKQIAIKVDELGGKSYFVGGYVRDKIFGIDNKDIDIEIHNITPSQLRKAIEPLGEIKTQGASFGILNIKGFDVDIAQPRKERNIGNSHTDFEVDVDPFIGIEEAARRRDFTINALMEDILTGEIIDPFNGLEDLKMGIIRHIDDSTFIEDPLRVLRAAQFCARFNFSIAPETQKLISTMDLSNLSKERIYDEMKKALLKSNKPSIFFEELKLVNQLDIWFPEIKALIGCEQNVLFHPEGDAWNHTMIVLDNAVNKRSSVSNPEFFMISALCHDLGKPVTKTIDSNGIIHNYKHDILGIPIIEQFLNRLNNNVNLHKYVTNMTLLHMKAHNLFNNKAKIKSTNKIFDNSIMPEDLCKLAYIDSESKNNSEESIEELLWLTERCKHYREHMKLPEVTGKDLISLGFKPGTIFSEILSETHKLHLSEIPKETVLKIITKKYAKEII